MNDLVILAEADGVATILLNRPEKLNAFADDMREQLAAAIDVAAARGARALVITGAGRAFSAGGDLHFMVGLKERGAGYEGLAPLVEGGGNAVARLAALPFPTIAAVNGPAAGGGLNLALACDLVVASEQATFGQTFVRIGLHPDWGGTWFLPRRVGLAKALELCWTGEMIDAREALRIGLVEHVWPHDAFGDEVKALAARLAAAPQTSVRLAKQALRAGTTRTLAECLAAETEAQQACWETHDAAEGIHAFVEKRKAQFGGGETAALAGAAAPSSAAPRFE
jgi:2-(1,2-epoxy-1,2-dihydrophenyl)acetyl-CoA isomerase